MINQEYFNTLSGPEKEMINALYQQLSSGEISMQQFVETVRINLGETVYTHLFTQPNAVPPRADNFSDILANTGVDLKHEMEFIIGSDPEIHNSFDEDEPANLASFVDFGLFCDFINKLAASRQMKVADNAYQTLLLVLKRKIFDLIDQIIEASKVRVDAERYNFDKVILNDTKRQLWILEQNEIKALDGLQIHHEDEAHRKIKKTVQEREDILVKKRMSNTVALAALGSRKFNWMDENVQDDKDRVIESLYAPYDEKDFEDRVKGRTITLEDFIYVLEHDKRYNKSFFLLKQYFLA